MKMAVVAQYFLLFPDCLHDDQLVADSRLFQLDPYVFFGDCISLVVCLCSLSTMLQPPVPKTFSCCSNVNMSSVQYY